MLETFILGLLLGWGAAIPMGPVNIEIMRRNLTYGWSAGFTLGLGACAADLCYILILSFGLLSILRYPMILGSLGMAGSLVLAWFAYGAFRLSTVPAHGHEVPRKSASRSFIEGLAMTLVNPFTVLFWMSVSAQLAGLSGQSHQVGIAAAGVILGTLSWITVYNATLHLTRKRITPRIRKILNIIAGLVLVGFAVYGFIHGLKLSIGALAV